MQATDGEDFWAKFSNGHWLHGVALSFDSPNGSSDQCGLSLPTKCRAYLSGNTVLMEET